MTNDIRYPVGRFTQQPVANEAARAQLIQHIEELPARIKAAVAGLTDAQLDTPYRPEGWTPRQIVHHVADSHMNAYIRFKLGMTEDNPTIKPYDEKKWAQTIDGASAPAELSLAVIDGIHRRWVQYMKSFDDGA